MKLFVFDIDGTLLDASGVDSRLYIDAVRSVLGEVRLRPEWSDYGHVTDQGLLRAIIQDNGMTHAEGVVDRVRRVFVQALTEHLQTHGPFAEIPGARAFVRSLHRSRDTRIAYATGGWARSARLKLRTAGFPLSGIPLASSDDYEDRASIMQSAAADHSDDGGTITYFGDGPWDQRACKELGWHFVAVGKKLGGIEAFDQKLFDGIQISEN